MMPPLQGILNQPNFFIYAACDPGYFDEFGPALINSVLKNTTFEVVILNKCGEGKPYFMHTLFINAYSMNSSIYLLFF